MPDIISVPYHSQEDPDAWKFRNDCGVVCVAMLLQWAGKGQISIDALSAETALARSDTGLTCNQLAYLLNSHGVSAYAVNGKADLAAIQREVAAQRPVIALIKYAAIPERQNIPYKGGHFVVVVG